MMIADYFTKPLQGVLFRQLRDMIMGNVEIALPEEVACGSADSTDRIPMVLTPQGSRSVLKQENETGSSLFSLTVLPASGSRTKDKQDQTADVDVPLASKAIKKACKKPSKPVECKRTLSWADVAKR
jgi:hypothetical protein